MSGRRTVFGIAMILVGLLAWDAAAEAGQRISLFNGEDLSGWRVKRCKATVEAGAIKIEAGNGLIQTKDRYGDFVLEFAWKALAEDNWDSGVYFRYDRVPPGRTWPQRYQVNLRKGMEGNVEGIAGAESTGLIRPGTWNTFKLTVKGASLSLEINGQEAWKADGLEGPQKGYIALQAEVPNGGEHLFKDIWLTPLD